MNPSEKLKLFQENKHTRFVRVESIKDGAVIVSDVFDTFQVTFYIIESEITRRTLALVDLPFNLRICNIECESVVGGFDLPPL